MPHSTNSDLVGTDAWLRAASYRRTVYGPEGTSSTPDDRTEEIIEKVHSFPPSPYNIQPIRYTLVTKQIHRDLWDAIITAAEPVLERRGEDT